MGSSLYSTFKLEVFSNKAYGVIENLIGKYVLEEEIQVFYPQNFDKKSVSIKVHMFMKNGIFIFSEIPYNSGFTVKYLPYNDIQELKMYYGEDPLKRDKITLQIAFRNHDNNIFLNNYEDTSERFRSSFTTELEKIFKFISIR